MHEYSIVGALLQQVEDAARGALRDRQGPAADLLHGVHGVQVHRLHVRIGELSGVEVPLLETAFRTFRERSPCADAELSIRRVPALWRCRRCHEPIARGAILRCIRCQAPAELAEGDEIILDRIEMTLPDAENEEAPHETPHDQTANRLEVA